MANLLTRLLRGEDITRGMTVDQYLKQLVESRLGSGYLAPMPEWGVRGQPVERPQPSFETYAREIYAAHPVIFGLMEARRQVFSEARFCWRAVANGNPGDVLPIRDGLEILENPWPGAQTGTLLSRMRQDADLGGTAFVAREDGRDGPRLRRLRPDWVHIILSGNPWEDLDVEFLGVAYAPNGPTNEPVRTYLPDQVAMWAPIPDPLAQFRGMSWLTPVIRELQADQAATDHRLSTLQKGAWLGPIVIAPQNTTLEQFKKFVEAADARHAGPNNAGRMVFLAPGSQVQTVAQSLRELDLKNITGAVETRLAVAARVPAVIAQISEGLQGSSLNTGNYQAAKRQWIDSSLRPDWRSLCEALSAIVTPPDLSGLDLPEGTEAQLWIHEADIALLHQDRLESAQVRQTNASTINTLITAGFEPKSIVEAVREDDLSRLKHTGLTSVQLNPPGMAPGQTSETSEGEEGPDVEGEDLYQRTLQQLRGEFGQAEGEEQVDRADYYNIRVPAGMRAGKSRGGQFRSLSSALIGALEAWINGEGPDDPLESFSDAQLRKAAGQLGVAVTPGMSRPRLKLALLNKARDDMRAQRREMAEARDAMPDGYRVERLEGGRFSVQREGEPGFAEADSLDEARRIAEQDKADRAEQQTRRRLSALGMPGGEPPPRVPVVPVTFRPGSDTPRRRRPVQVAERDEVMRRIQDAMADPDARKRLADLVASGKVSWATAHEALTGKADPAGTSAERLDRDATLAFVYGMVHAGHVTELAWTGNRARVEQYLRTQNTSTLHAIAPFFAVNLPGDVSHDQAVRALAEQVMRLEAPRRTELPDMPEPELRQMLMSRKVKDLQASLRAAGLPTAGRKAELVDRLVAAYRTVREDRDDSADRAGPETRRDGRGRGRGAAAAQPAAGESGAAESRTRPGGVGGQAGRVATRPVPARPGRVSVAESRDWTPEQHIAHAENARQRGDNAEARLHRGLADAKHRRIVDDGRGLEYLRGLQTRDDARRFLRSLTREQLDELARQLGVDTSGGKGAVIARILLELFGPDIQVEGGELPSPRVDTDRFTQAALADLPTEKGSWLRFLARGGGGDPDHPLLSPKGGRHGTAAYGSRPTGRPPENPARAAAAEQAIRDAYAAIQSRRPPGAPEWISMRELRDELADRFLRSEVDDALQRMFRGGEIFLTTESDQTVLSVADMAASVIVGGESKQLLSFAPVLEFEDF